MLKLVPSPDARLLSDLSEEKRTNTAMAKYTADDRGDIKFYKTGDGQRTYMRVTETIPPEGKGSATYKFTMFEVLPPLGGQASPAPTILSEK